MTDDTRLEEARQEMNKWEARRQAERRDAKTRLEKKLARYSDELGKMSIEERHTILAEAKQRGFIDEIDDFILDYIHLFPDRLGPILEEREHGRSGV